MNAIQNFNAALNAAEKLVQAHRKEVDMWFKSGRAGAMPQMEEGINIVVMGNVSCMLSAPAQNARTKACRRNFKINGKRVTEDKAVMALAEM